mmetsp:Transcript_16702/g.27626  ORF Transcript_16702/g.27626 Transcript_16702/m.27626 type:complete len:645 (-) Transcript_16702:478-2412(-)
MADPASSQLPRPRQAHPSIPSCSGPQKLTQRAALNRLKQAGLSKTSTDRVGLVRLVPPAPLKNDCNGGTRYLEADGGNITESTRGQQFLASPVLYSFDSGADALYKAQAPADILSTASLHVAPTPSFCTNLSRIAPITSLDTLPSYIAPFASSATVPSYIAPNASSATVPSYIAPIASSATVPSYIAPIASSGTVPSHVAPTSFGSVASYVAPTTSLDTVGSYVAPTDSYGTNPTTLQLQFPIMTSFPSLQTMPEAGWPSVVACTSPTMSEWELFSPSTPSLLSPDKPLSDQPCYSQHSKASYPVSICDTLGLYSNSSVPSYAKSSVPFADISTLFSDMPSLLPSVSVDLSHSCQKSHPIITKSSHIMSHHTRHSDSLSTSSVPAFGHDVADSDHSYPQLRFVPCFNGPDALPVAPPTAHVGFPNIHPGTYQTFAIVPIGLFDHHQNGPHFIENVPKYPSGRPTTVLVSAVDSPPPSMSAQPYLLPGSTPLARGLEAAVYPYLHQPTLQGALSESGDGLLYTPEKGTKAHKSVKAAMPPLRAKPVVELANGHGKNLAVFNPPGHQPTLQGALSKSGDGLLCTTDKGNKTHKSVKVAMPPLGAKPVLEPVNGHGKDLAAFNPHVHPPSACPKLDEGLVQVGEHTL